MEICLVKKTLIAGASPNTERYAFKAACMLQQYGHDFIPVGIKKGEVLGKPILNEWPENIEDLDTVTLYIGQEHQKPIYEKILLLKPRRIIFNPGTENPELAEMAEKAGIRAENACTLVLLSTGQY
jgi:predicted CoA-binding protein